MIKVVKIIFIVLIIITISELIYYLYSFKSLNKGFPGRIEIQNTITGQNSCYTGPTPIPGVNDKDICNKITYFNASAGQKLKMVVEQNGIIRNVQRNYKTSIGTTIDTRFAIYDSDGVLMQNYGFNEADLHKFYDVFKLDNNGNRIQSSLSELADNRKIQIRVEEDAKVAKDMKGSVFTEILIMEK